MPKTPKDNRKYIPLADGWRKRTYTGNREYISCSVPKDVELFIKINDDYWPVKVFQGYYTDEHYNQKNPRSPVIRFKFFVTKKGEE